MRIGYGLLLCFLFAVMGCGSTSSAGKVIAVQGFGNIDAALIDTIKNTIEELYEFDRVVVLEPKDLPKTAFVNVKSPRYRADTLLRILKREMPDSIDYVIGILNKDISTTKRDALGNILKPENKYTDWGIFGLAYRPGPSCVLSTFRIKSASKSKFIERMKKVCMHEIGHNLGLKHCDKHPKCVMRDAAETIKTVDQVDLKLCAYCLSQVN